MTDPPGPILEALPVGAIVFDARQTLRSVNPAAFEVLRLAPGSLRPGTGLADAIRLLAFRGLLGPGDPDDQVEAVLGLCATAPQVGRHVLGAGHTYEAHYLPLSGGALLICLLDTSSFTARRHGAEQALGEMHAAIGNLSTGFAVFGADRALVLHNGCFPTLLDLPPASLRPGMAFDAVLQLLRRSDDFAGPEGARFLERQAVLDRGRPVRDRRVRASGAVLDLHSDPLPGGGFTLALTDVSALMNAEHERQRRAAMLDSIIRQFPHGIAVFGPDRRATMVNGAYGRIMDGAPLAVGDSQEEIVRRRAAAGEYGDDDHETAIQRQLGYDVSVPQARRRRRRNGATIDIRTAPLPDGGHISVVTDVTDQVEAEAEAERRAELMAGIVSHIPHGVSVYDPNYRLRLVNAAYHQVMDGAPISIGDSVEQIIERRARAGEFGPGDPDQIIAQQRAHDNTRAMQRRRTRPNGKTIDIRTAPLPDGGHISVVTDVTSLIAAEAEIMRRAQDMDAMLSHIRHGIVLWDKDRRIIAANGVAESMVRAPPGFLVAGRTLEETIQAALERGNLGEGPTAEARARWLREQDRTRPQQDQRLTKTGRVLEVRSDPTPGGGFVTTYTDVTQTREAEDALRLSSAAAQAANVAKSRFLAAMSTELRTPLQDILRETASLSRDAAATRGRFGPQAGTEGIAPGRVRDAAEAVSEAARTLLRLIDTILDVARLEAGRFDLADDVIDVTGLVRQCLRTHDAAAAAAEIGLITDLAPMLPRIRGDERRLRQALSHLLDNAVRFTGAMGTVCLGARLDDRGDLLLSVTDDGVGIAEADLQRVCEPFTQLAATGAERPAGAGLGLYISRMLLRAHEGELVLDSQPGHGTIATLRIPASRVLTLRDAVTS